MKALPIKKTIALLAIGAIACIVFYNTKDAFIGAKLSLHSALDGTTVQEAFLPISGSAKHAIALQINGRPVAIDTSGVFHDGALLSPGYNIIEITEKDRFGKEKRRVLHVVAQPSTSVATAMSIHYQ